MTTPAYDPSSYIEAQHWVFAKTVPDEPHWYVVIETSTDPDEHLRLVEWLRTSPETEFWHGRVPYRYRTVGAFRYWVGPRTIINRRVVDGPSPTTPHRMPAWPPEPELGL